MEQLDDGAPQLEFDVAREADSTVVVTVAGELDTSNVGRLQAAVMPAIRAGAERLVVDIGGLQFADSSAIAVWVRWAAQVERIELRSASPLLRQVINRMGLSEKLGIRA